MILQIYYFRLAHYTGKRFKIDVSQPGYSAYKIGVQGDVFVNVQNFSSSQKMVMLILKFPLVLFHRRRIFNGDPYD